MWGDPSYLPGVRRCWSATCPPPGSGTWLRASASRADLSLPGDPLLSGTHFVVECEQDRCLLRDLESVQGTFVNGARVTEVVLRNGDQIIAGSTTFAVSLSSAPPAPHPAEPSAA